MSRRLRVAVQMDPLERINISEDSTFAMMMEAQARGYEVCVYQVSNLQLQLNPEQTCGNLLARMRPVKLQRLQGQHALFGEEQLLSLTDMDVVLMRQDPPFDMSYITATYMLEQVHGTGAGKVLVVNDPRSVRDAPEKLVATLFPSLMPPTLISADVQALRDFRREWKDIILKPLYGNGGAGIFRVREDDENFSSIIEMHRARTSEPLMAQRYEPAVRHGDKRILLVEGRPVGAINRVPALGDARANMHAGGKAEKAELTERDEQICRTIGPFLRERGLIFVGIDVIGNWLTEINVTSPTGIQEIDRFNNTNVASRMWDAILVRLAL